MCRGADLRAGPRCVRHVGRVALPGASPADREAGATRAGTAHHRLMLASCSAAFPLLGWRCLDDGDLEVSSVRKPEAARSPVSLASGPLTAPPNACVGWSHVQPVRDGASDRIHGASSMRGEIHPGAGTARCAAVAPAPVPPQQPAAMAAGARTARPRFGVAAAPCTAWRCRPRPRQRGEVEQVMGSSAHVCEAPHPALRTALLGEPGPIWCGACERGCVEARPAPRQVVDVNGGRRA